MQEEHLKQGTWYPPIHSVVRQTDAHPPARLSIHILLDLVLNFKSIVKNV